jgi:hypothetical protein
MAHDERVGLETTQEAKTAKRAELNLRSTAR